MWLQQQPQEPPVLISKKETRQSFNEAVVRRLRTVVVRRRLSLRFVSLILLQHATHKTKKKFTT